MTAPRTAIPSRAPRSPPDRYRLGRRRGRHGRRGSGWHGRRAGGHGSGGGCRRRRRRIGRQSGWRGHRSHGRSAYWEKSYTAQPYYQSGYTYDDYGPAYRTGYLGRSQFKGRTYDQVERDLETEYNRSKGTSRLEWERAKPATRAAWDRVECVVAFQSEGARPCRKTPLSGFLPAHPVGDPGQRNRQRGTSERFDKLRVLGIKAADLVEDAGIMLLGRVAISCTCSGVNCDACWGVNCGTPAFDGADIRPRMPPPSADNTPGPIERSNWLRTPACCCGFDWPNIWPTISPKGGVLSARNASATPCPNISGGAARETSSKCSCAMFGLGTAGVGVLLQNIHQSHHNLLVVSARKSFRKIC